MRGLRGGWGEWGSVVGGWGGRFRARGPDMWEGVARGGQCDGGAGRIGCGLWGVWGVVGDLRGVLG